MKQELPRQMRIPRGLGYLIRTKTLTLVWLHLSFQMKTTEFASFHLESLQQV
jgi:hypothetical protein